MKRQCICRFHKIFVDTVLLVKRTWTNCYYPSAASIITNHRTKLCRKIKNPIYTVMKLVIFIRGSSCLQPRIFRVLLKEMSAEHHD